MAVPPVPDGRNRQQQYRRQPYSPHSPSTAKQLPERTVRTEEEHQPRKQQNEVARIRDADTPRIACHRQRSALPVGIVSRLVEPVRPVTENTVHAHHCLLPLPVRHQCKTAYKVARCRCTRIIFHPEVIQHQCKRQRYHPAVRSGKRTFRSTLPQMYPALHTPHMGNQCSQQNHRKRQVQTKSRPVLLHPATNQIKDGCDSRHGPTDNKPRGSVYIPDHPTSAPHFLHTRGCHQHPQQHPQQTERKIS